MAGTDSLAAMTIVVFGANGRAGRRIVAEAAGRGLDPKAVVRDPTAYGGPTGDHIRVVAGDVTNLDDVRRLVVGASAVVSAVSSMSDPEGLFPLAAGILAAGVIGRLVIVGIGTTLKGDAGVPLYESQGFPDAGLSFSVAHARELETLRAAGESLDWVVVAPPPMLLDDEATSGRAYRTAVGTMIATDEPFSYADLAGAVIDEIETPRHHRVLLAVAR